MVTTYLDVSIGPVQGFVAQSRRTRDLWGSSYLLSFLAAHAMCGANQAGGTIVRPMVVEDPLFAWASGRREGEAPAIGSIPNHFTVSLDADHSVEEVAAAMTHAFRRAWDQVCEAVWDRFVEHAQTKGKATQAIWQRQVSSFWEIVWVAVLEQSDDALSRRKHWRDPCPADEPGDKCAVMPELEELSGYTRAQSSDERRRQDDFWIAVRGRLGPLDLRENERLSAIALIKRLYVKVANAALGWSVDGSHWRSTVYVGAVPWIRDVLDRAPAAAKDYADTVKRFTHRDVLAEPRSQLAEAAAGDFPRLDGNYFHRGFLADPRLCPLNDEGDDGSKREHLKSQLRALYSCAKSPPVFYALLLADGDHVGDLVRKIGGRGVGEALSRFTSEVQAIVNSHDGQTIYAGGDDVLAMLPLAEALTCARALAHQYADAFRTVDGAVVGEATLSTALVFAHVRLPLRSVLDIARTLLDDEAKVHNGYNSLAVGVLKRGGLHSQWVTTWSRQRDNSDAVDLILELAKVLRDDVEGEPGFSSSLLYRLRDTLGLLCDWPGWTPGRWQPLPAQFGPDDVRDFVYAEVLRSVSPRLDEAREARATSITERICPLLYSAEALAPARQAVGIDALTLARFLANDGREEDDS